MRTTTTHPDASRSCEIAKAPGHWITSHEPRLPRTEWRRPVITFGTLQSDLAEAGFGTELCLRSGHPTIHVATRRGAQYQELPLETFVRAVRPALAELGRARPAVYGASLGAYAAVHFGGSIDADIIAAAPQCPAMPELRMRHAQTTPMRHADLRTVPRGLGRAVVFWDPHERPDSILVNDFIRPLHPDAVYREYPFAGHKVLETMARLGVVRDFVLPLLRDMTLVPIELPTTGNPFWHCNFARHLLAQREIGAARHHAETSFELRPSPENIQLLARIFLREGMVERGRAFRARLEADAALRRITFGPARRNLEALLA